MRQGSPNVPDMLRLGIYRRRELLHAQNLLRFAATCAALASMCLSTLPASADGIENVYEQSRRAGSERAIKNAMEAERKKAGSASAVRPPAQRGLQRHRRAGAAGQPAARWARTSDSRPASATAPTLRPRTRTETSAAYGKQGWLMGGVDASLSYAFRPTTRFVASMFQLQHWPYGFNSGLAPIYVQGFKNPVGCADLSGGNACGPGAGQNLNVRTKDTFGIFMVEQLFLIKGMPGGHVLPIVISPTYVARGGISASPVNNNDVVPFAYNPPDGPFFTDVPTRTAQFKVAGRHASVPQNAEDVRNVYGRAGVARAYGRRQLQQPHAVAADPLSRVHARSRIRSFSFEPQSARDYLPTDPYPEHLIAYFVGVSQRFAKYGFVQLVLNSGNPTNLGPDGVTAIKCLTVSPQLCGPVVGGLKATQLQLQFGIGSPNYFPL